MGHQKKTAECIVDALIEDLRDRRGFRQVWEETDDDVMDEMRDKWVAIVRDGYTSAEPATWTRVAEWRRDVTAVLVAIADRHLGNPYSASGEIRAAVERLRETMASAPLVVQRVDIKQPTTAVSEHGGDAHAAVSAHADKVAAATRHPAARLIDAIWELTPDGDKTHSNESGVSDKRMVRVGAVDAPFQLLSTISIDDLGPMHTRLLHAKACADACPAQRSLAAHLDGARVHGHIIENYGDQPGAPMLRIDPKYLPPPVCLSRKVAQATRDFAAWMNQAGGPAEPADAYPLPVKGGPE